MISRLAINPRLSILCIYYVGKVHRYIGILYTDERRGMLDGYLTTGMAKGYVQYTVYEMDARAEMEWGQIFHFRSIAQDDVCMCQRDCLGKQLKMRAVAEVL